MAKRIIPIEEWGQDHWSTLAYLESCVVDKDGFLDPKKMRTSSKYPTRLKTRVEESHTDWDCVADMIADGLVCIVHDGPIISKNISFPRRQYALTEKGWEIVKRLRQYRADGGHWHDFHFATSGHVIKHYYHYSATVQETNGNITWNSGKVEIDVLVNSEEGYEKMRESLREVFGTDKVCLIAYQHICSKREK